ncbi:MAG: PIN domain-containing protein [Acidobacteria bacterium]|nr:PIN domain-containing protein [Acidobacteriota bacterium]
MRRNTIPTLDEIPNGSRIFIDASIFIYHFTGVSKECRRLLERCEQGGLEGIVSVTLLAEVSHRLMMIEAVSKKLVEPGNVAQKLRSKPSLVRKLGSYQEQIDRIPLMGIEVRPVDLATLHRSRTGRESFGLLTNDSIVLASLEEVEADGLATGDQDFLRVRGLKVFHPNNLG